MEMWPSDVEQIVDLNPVVDRRVAGHGNEVIAERVWPAVAENPAPLASPLVER